MSHGTFSLSSKRVAQAAQFGVSPDFVQTIFVAIHEESVRHQMEIMR
jgi:hypothetical protein